MSKTHGVNVGWGHNVYLKDVPWEAERYRANVANGYILAWRVVALVKEDDDLPTKVTVADLLDQPTAELIADANK